MSIIYFKYLPVWLVFILAMSAGVPCPTIWPPPSPPSGPKSISQSAHLIKSMLCSMVITVFFFSTSPPRTEIHFLMSSKCKPVVGSSKIYKVLPVPFLESSVANFTLCASPPDNEVAACPNST